MPSLDGVREAEIFVFTAANAEAQRHRKATIDQTVSVARMEPFAKSVAARLSADGHKEVRCWGSVPKAPGKGNVTSWKRMQPGHWGLLYGDEQRFQWLLRVCHKAESKSLARELWGEDSKGRTWELMFFFDHAIRVDLGVPEVRRALAYPGEGWSPQGLQYPKAENQEALLEKFGSFPAFASASAGPTAKAPPPPSLKELLMGRKRKRRKRKPPRSPRHRLPPDPDRSGRGFMAHEDTVDLLHLHIGSSFREGTPGVNHDGAWEHGRRFCICEVKSVTAKNEVDQLRKGLGQILHNRFKAQDGRREKVKAYLIAEREPSNSSLWVALAAESGVVFTWPERFEADIPKP
jgi:hypothetical protein